MGSEARSPLSSLIPMSAFKLMILPCEAQVAVIFEWVSDALRHVGATYELILPSRKPLVTAAGNVRAADLLPSALLNFRWLEVPPPAGPTLRDALMAAAVPAAS